MRGPLAAAVLLAAVSACSAEGSGGASIRLALAADPDRCADFCATEAGADLLDADGGGTVSSVTAACGEVLEFAGLPAGHRYRVRAWVGRNGVRRLAGESGAVVVAAGEVTAVSVPLSAAVEPPDVASVSPDPVAPGGADLTVTGTGFGDRIGAHEVTLDGVALEVVDWADDRVVARVPAGVAGDEVRVRACGLRSAAAPARVLAPEPGSLTVRPDVPCLGLAFEAAEPIPGTADVLLFATCAGIPGIAGYLRPLRGVGCAFSGITHPLSRAPLAFAPEPGGTHAWVAYADGADGSIERVGLADGTVTPGPALPQGLAVRDVAFAGGVPWVLAGGDGKTVLLRDGAPVEAFGDSQAVAMTAAGDRVALAARDGFLVTADDDEVLFKKLSDCDPVAVAARGGWTAVACGGAAPGVIGVGPDGEPTPKRGTAAGPDALWLDSKGDVAFAWSEAGGSVTALHLVGTASHAVAGQVGRLLSGFPGGSRLLFSAPNGALRVLDPYGSEGGCE